MSMKQLLIALVELAAFIGTLTYLAAALVAACVTGGGCAP